MKKALSKTLVVAILMSVSTQAFANLDLADQALTNAEMGVDLEPGRIAAVESDNATLKEMLAERLATLGAMLEGGGDAKIGTVIDTKIQALQAGDRSSAELLQDINEINLLINHVDKN